MGRSSPPPLVLAKQTRRESVRDQGGCRTGLCAWDGSGVPRVVSVPVLPRVARPHSRSRRLTRFVAVCRRTDPRPLPLAPVPRSLQGLAQVLSLSDCSFQRPVALRSFAVRRGYRLPGWLSVPSRILLASADQQRRVKHNRRGTTGSVPARSFRVAHIDGIH